MRLIILSSVFCLLASAYGHVAQIPWDVQQDRPVAHDVAVWQGETVDLLPRLVQGIRPVAITNAPVEFRYRESSLPTNTFRRVAAAASTNNGVVAVRWLPDYDAGAAWYDYQVVVGSNAANPRCFGRIIMRPTIGWHASTNPPPPITLFPSIADLQAASNALAQALQVERDVRSSADQTNAAAIAALDSAALKKTATNGWTVSSHAGFLTTEQDLVSLAALAAYAATSRVERIMERVTGSSAWYTLASNTLTRWEIVEPQWQITVQAYDNGSVTHPGGTYPVSNMRGWPARTGLYPFGVGGAVLITSSEVYVTLDGVAASWYATDDVDPEYVSLTEWSSEAGQGDFPVALWTSDPSTVTNSTVCYLPTNLVPAETWSYTDHTNWMEFGNAGQQWVSDLAADEAWTFYNYHVNEIEPHPGKYLSPSAVTNAVRAVEAWISYTNVVGSVTLTNLYEAPIRLHGTGAVHVAFSGLRSPYPVYLVARGPSALAFPGAYIVGGGTWQTNMSNHFVCWVYGTNLLINPVTATED